ncbi:heterokaryon incompatibility protein het-E-1 [Fusarium circinatum]|uniref:Heterokaryon incompatibility protein het-E-1 n=1 Tax=Fusarium circinatum TaxID=48490 RepID=A0A8H5T5I7_FUSCI|nr:heterokaryon incompatibility protein het-E-1 [Fusarium circinatum]
MKLRDLVHRVRKRSSKSKDSETLALVVAHERSEIYGTIAHSTVGVVFLATPHRGSSLAAPAEFASMVLRAAQLGTGTNKKLVASLRKNAELLWDISSQFVGRASGIHIKSFYETDCLPYMSSLVVDKNSAVLQLPNEIATPMLNTNHRTICRFSHPGCQNYALIQDETTLRIIQRFHKSNYVEYKAFVKPPVEDTCTWILQETEYLLWLESPSSSLLWISGDPGCGKTTIAAFLIDSMEQHPEMQNTDFIMTYFVFDANIAAQLDGTALLFALIHQLLQAKPTLAPLAEKYLNQNQSKLGISLHTLCEIFKAIILSPEMKPCRIICVLDALDECESASMAKLVSFLCALSFDYSNREGDSGGGWLKFAVTSRHNQAIDDLFRALPPYHRIRLEEHAAHTMRDISRFVQVRCAQIQTITRCSDSIRRIVEKQLIHRSDNTFLWVHMVLDLLETDTNATPQSFETTLGSIPDRLDGLYDGILRRSAAPDTLLRILSIIAASQRALNLEEIDIALAVRSGDTSICQMQRRCQFDIARHLYAVCGPFIRIRNGTVSFIHHTATEFLLRAPDIPQSPEETKMYQYKSCLDVAGVNYCLAEICVIYLLLADVVSSETSLDPEVSGYLMDLGDEDSHDKQISAGEESNILMRPNTEKGSALFDYAAKHWGDHCGLGKVSPDSSIFTKVISLCDTSSDTFRSWFQLYWDTISTIPRFPDGLTPLMLASHIGLPDVMQALLLTDSKLHCESHLREADSEGWTALHWAVWNGNGSPIDTDVMEILLELRHDEAYEGGKYSNTQDTGSDYYENELETDPGTAVLTRVLDIQDKKGMTPLHWAAVDNQVGVMRLLLNAGATVDVFDSEERKGCMRYLESPTRSYEVVQAFLWRVIVHEIFEKFEWLGVDTCDDFRHLRHGLKPPLLVNPQGGPPLPNHEAERKFHSWSSTTISMLLTSIDVEKANNHMKHRTDNHVKRIINTVSNVLRKDRERSLKNQLSAIITEAFALDKEISRQVARMIWRFNVFQLEENADHPDAAPSKPGLVMAPAVFKRGKSTGEGFDHETKLLDIVEGSK